MSILEEADALRTTDRLRALALYAEQQQAISALDEERIVWICEQVSPTPPPELAPLLERVPEDAPEDLRRAALHGRATIAWYLGRAEEAERLWVGGLRFPHAVRDRFWIRSCLNVAMVLHQRHSLFEALVLAGMGLRAARALGRPYLSAYAALRRTGLLLEMGELECPLDDIARAAEDLTQIRAEGERRVIELELRDVTAELQDLGGDREAALLEREQQIAWLEAYPSVEAGILADAHMTCLQLRFELRPERSAEVLAEFASLPERFELGSSWTERWSRNLAELRIRHAAASGQEAQALQHARRLLELLREGVQSARKVPRALRLGRFLARELGEAELAREAFELAARASLMRVLEADRSAREIPELAEASAQDWYILRGYRMRLQDEQRDLLDAVAADLKAGAPAFDLIVRDELICICAWCYRVRTSENAWLPIAHFIPSSASFGVTHGICEACRERYF